METSGKGGDENPKRILFCVAIKVICNAKIIIFSFLKISDICKD
jgi:hypothetical protein